MRTRARGRHAAALVAPERPVDLERPDRERVLRNLLEYPMRVERAVITCDARVIATDDQIGAAVVLTEQRVQQRLARPGVAHVERITGLQHGAGAEITIDQHS